MDSVTLEHLGDVAHLQLNRPDKHNAFDDQIISELIDHLNAIKSHAQTRVLVLSATGKSFSAGADLAWMKRMAKHDFATNYDDAKQLALLMRELNELPIPTVAKVKGNAFGGAIGLIACCDIAIASEHSKFCLSEAKLGLAPATIGPYVYAAMGERRCRQLFLTAEIFTARQAEQWSLLHTVCPAEELDNVVQNAIDHILATGPQASRSCKALIKTIKTNGADLEAYTAKLIAELRVSKEGQAGLSAFFDRTAPPWKP